jgi:hypothetical protein
MLPGDLVVMVSSFRLMMLLTTVSVLLVLCVVLSVPSLFVGPSDAEAVNVVTTSDWHGILGWQDDGGIATNVVICQWLRSGFVRKHGVAETDGRTDQDERDSDRGDDFLHITENSTVQRYPWVAQFRQPANNYYFHNRSDPSFAPRRRLRYTAYITCVVMVSPTTPRRYFTGGEFFHVALVGPEAASLPVTAEPEQQRYRVDYYAPSLPGRYLVSGRFLYSNHTGLLDYNLVYAAGTNNPIGAKDSPLFLQYDRTFVCSQYDTDACFRTLAEQRNRTYGFGETPAAHAMFITVTAEDAAVSCTVDPNLLAVTASGDGVQTLCKSSNDATVHQQQHLPICGPDTGTDPFRGRWLLPKDKWDGEGFTAPSGNTATTFTTTTNATTVLSVADYYQRYMKQLVWVPQQCRLVDYLKQGLKSSPAPLGSADVHSPATRNCSANSIFFVGDSTSEVMLEAIGNMHHIRPGIKGHDAYCHTWNSVQVCRVAQLGMYSRAVWSLNGSSHTRDIRVVWAAFNAMKRYISMFSKNKRTVVVIQGGLWEAAFSYLDEIEWYWTQYLNLLEKERGFKAGQWRIAFLNSNTINYDLASSPDGWKAMSLPRVMAVNELLSRLFRQRGYPVLDRFALSAAMHHQSRDGYHFHASTTIVGRAILNAAMNYVCHLHWD